MLVTGLEGACRGGEFGTPATLLDPSSFASQRKQFNGPVSKWAYVTHTSKFHDFAWTDLLPHD